MKNSALILSALFVLTACATPNPDRSPRERNDSRYFPEKTTPGIHVSGQVQVGIVKEL